MQRMESKQSSTKLLVIPTWEPVARCTKMFVFVEQKVESAKLCFVAGNEDLCDSHHNSLVVPYPAHSLASESELEKNSTSSNQPTNPSLSIQVAPQPASNMHQPTHQVTNQQNPTTNMIKHTSQILGCWFHAMQSAVSTESNNP